MCDKPYEINSCGNYIIDTVIRIDKLQKKSYLIIMAALPAKHH